MCLFCHVSCTNGFLSILLIIQPMARRVGRWGQELWGNSNIGDHARWRPGNPGSPASSRDLANGPGGLRGLFGGAGLASAPVGTERPSCSPIPPEADPGHLGSDDSTVSETGLRVHGKCTAPGLGEPGAASISCHVMEPRTRGPAASESERWEGRRQNSQPLTTCEDQAEPGVIHTL